MKLRLVFGTPQADIIAAAEGIIFDFNGTMFFDDAFQEASWKIFLENSINRPVSDEEFRTYVHGRNMDESLAYFFKRKFSQSETKELEEEKETVYRKLCLRNPDKFKLADGLPEFLDKLTELKLPFTIATASGEENVNFFFEHLHLHKWFDLNKVVYNDGTIPGKPKPDIYLKAAKIIGVSPENCVVFEDAPSGIESAKNAGVGAIIGVCPASCKNTSTKDSVLTEINDYRHIKLYPAESTAL